MSENQLESQQQKVPTSGKPFAVGRAAADGFDCCGAIILQIGLLFSLSFFFAKLYLRLKCNEVCARTRTILARTLWYYNAYILYRVVQSSC